MISDNSISENSPLRRGRAWFGFTRTALRTGAPLLAAVLVFSCTAYAPALDWDTDRQITTLVTNMDQPSGSSRTVAPRRP